MGKKQGTQTTTENSSTNYPQWTQDALQGLLGAGVALNQNFIQPPAYATAGLNADQMKAFDLARLTAQDAFTTGAPNVPTSAVMQAAQVGAPTLATTARIASPTMANAARIGAPTMARAAQVTGSEIAGNLNPYLDAVLQPALKQALRSRNENQAQIGQAAAAAGSFGGSREAIQRGQADRAYQESTQELVANLMSQGWDQASALAQANAQMRQQTDLTNAGAANASTLAQAGYDQQTALANAEAANAVALQQAAYEQQVALANAGAANSNAAIDAGYRQTANQQNLAYGLDAAQIQEALRTSYANRQQTALQQLLGIGNQQQQFAQTALDTPYTALARYASLVPQVYNTSSTGTSTSPSNKPSLFQTLLGAGTTLGAAYLSDKDTKTNIQLLGLDPDTGLKTYAYDYKADVAEAKRTGQPMGPKRVGPMAQEHAQAGGTTKRVGGHLAMIMGMT